MDALTAFGLVAVSMMLLFYTLESRDAGFVLAFAAASLAASAYGFLQGAWPFGVVEVVMGGGRAAPLVGACSRAARAHTLTRARPCATRRALATRALRPAPRAWRRPRRSSSTVSSQPMQASVTETP